MRDYALTRVSVERTYAIPREQRAFLHGERVLNSEKSSALDVFKLRDDGVGSVAHINLPP